MGFLNAKPSSGVNGDNSHLDGRTRNLLCAYAEITSSRVGFLIISNLLFKLAKLMLFGDLKNGGQVTITIVNEKITLVAKPKASKVPLLTTEVVNDPA